jgi:NAD(P)-dependent dehydrogenase (short-subunit alcohol dehydrogenase family)
MVFRVMDRSEVQGLTEAKVPELQGARVLVTGIHRACGADIVRAFAGQGARVLVQINDPSLSADALTETASGSVLEVAAQPADGFDGLAATRLAQKAAAAMGALDVAVNVIPFSSLDGDGLASADDLEDVLARKLSAALKSTAVLANRMGLTWTSGLVLNVLTLGGPDDAQDAADPMLQLLLRDALALTTRLEAQRWAPQGVRINGVVYAGDETGMTDEDPIAAAAEAMARGAPTAVAMQSSPLARVVLHLSSDAGADLTGLVFDA